MSGPRNIAVGIKRKLRAGWSYTDICSEFKCSKGTVAYHAATLGKANKRGFYRREYDPELVTQAATGARSVAEILVRMNIPCQTGAYPVIRKILTSKGVPIPDGRIVSDREKARRLSAFMGTLRVYDNGNQVCTHRMHLGLLRHGIRDRKCYKCGGVSWMGKPIPLELHHKNGIRRDCRDLNLELLCPNCHAQTDSYCGKNIGRNVKVA